MPHPRMESVLKWDELERLARDLKGSVELLSGLGYIAADGNELRPEALDVVADVLRGHAKRLQAALDRADEAVPDRTGVASIC